LQHERARSGALRPAVSEQRTVVRHPSRSVAMGHGFDTGLLGHQSKGYRLRLSLVGTRSEVMGGWRGVRVGIWRATVRHRAIEAAGCGSADGVQRHELERDSVALFPGPRLENRTAYEVAVVRAIAVMDLLRRGLPCAGSWTASPSLQVWISRQISPSHQASLSRGDHGNSS